MCFLWNDHGEAKLHWHWLYTRSTRAAERREASKPADVPERGVWITNRTALLPQQQTWTLLPGSDRQGKRRQNWPSHLAWETWRCTWVLGKALLSSQPVLHHLGWREQWWQRRQRLPPRGTEATGKAAAGSPERRDHCRWRVSFLSTAADACWFLGCIHMYTTSKQNCLQIFRIARTVYIIKRKKG